MGARKNATMRIGLLLAVAALLSGCSTGGKVTRMQLDRCEARLNAVSKEKEQLQKQLNAKEIELARAQSKLQTVTTRYEEEAQKSRRREDELRARSAPLSSLEQGVRRLGFPVERVGCGISVNLAAAGRLFDPGQIRLSQQAQDRLRPLALLLGKSGSGVLVSVQGHSDNTPIVRQKERYPTNYELSFARARTIQEYLVQVAGLDRKHCYPASKGEHDPIESNKTRAGQARNRRVELLIMPR